MDLHKVLEVHLQVKANDESKYYFNWAFSPFSSPWTLRVKALLSQPHEIIIHTEWHDRLGELKRRSKGSECY